MILINIINYCNYLYCILIIYIISITVIIGFDDFGIADVQSVKQLFAGIAC